MAAGFKQATVNAADVPATQTNFPAYVDLSRVGITTLAEAQSVRCYSDSSKTTELAREIVSATEMHVKVPSLTSTFVLYVDYDGVRADYAVTDTYGRNAVWSDYVAVYHFQSDGTDSTGNGNTGTVTNATNGAQKIGNGYSFDGTNDKISLGRLSGIEGKTTLTHQQWIALGVINSTQQIWGKDDVGVSNAWQSYVNSTGSQLFISAENINDRANYGVSGWTLNTLYLMHVVFDGGATGNSNRLKIFKNGANDSANVTYTGTVGTQTTTSTLNEVFGERSGGSGDWTGKLDELRFRASALSNNWITTEYNNQSDEPGFWGTWTNVGGGTTPTPLLMLMGMGS